MDSVLQLEVSQRDSSNVFANGDFVNELAVPVILEEGDQLVLNKTFIDTLEENSGEIEIDKNITVKLNVLTYVTGDLTEKYRGVTAVATVLPQDNVDYFPIRIQSNRPGTAIKNIIQITMVEFYYDYVQGTQNFGSKDNPLFLYYFDANEVFTLIPFQIPEASAGSANGAAWVFNVKIVATDMSTKHPHDPRYNKSAAYNRGMGVMWNGQDKGDPAPDSLEKLWKDNGCNPVAMTTEQYNGAGSKHSSYLHGGFYVLELSELPATVDAAAIVETDLFSVDIAEGKYTTTEMTTLLNNAFVQNNTTPQFSYDNLINSPFMKYAYQPDPSAPKERPSGFAFNGASDFIAGTGNNSTRNHVLVSNDTPGLEVDVDLKIDGPIGYNPPRISCLKSGYIMGSDSIEIEYDDESNKFYWKQLHQSIYDTQSGNVSTQISRRQNEDGSLTNFIRTKSGGVCFTSMYACLQSDENTHYDFWDAKLGFDVSKMQIPLDLYKEIDMGDDTIICSVPKIIDGVHTTNAIHTINGINPKTDNAYLKIPVAPGYNLPDEPTAFKYVESNNNQVIFADKVVVTTIDNSRTSSGYFLIEMVAGFYNTMIGSDKTDKNIHSIVNRYFNKGSYTSSTASDSMIYEHKGAPLILSSLRTRILLPDRTIPTGLGEDNTIFIQIVKAPKQPQPAPEEQKD